ncbi:unnamed protein product [Ectocarpus sp. CCAP 1310/34]|nr:unnamed protein product [Ectocarpus sp. CCAP 1310/34]
MSETKRTLTCWCGDVEMELVGAPLASLHCHCGICQKWSGAPFQWLVLYKADKTSVVKGKDNVTITRTSEDMERGRRTCTSHLYNNRGGHIFAIPGVVIKGIRSEDRTIAEGFAPSAEIFYATRVQDSNGGLPTFDSVPTLT